MNDNGISQVPVLTGEQIKGVVQEKDLLKPLYEGEYHSSDSISLALTNSFQVIDQEELLSKVTDSLLNKQTVIVLEKEKIKSLLTNIDILQFISHNGEL